MTDEQLPPPDPAETGTSSSQESAGVEETTALARYVSPAAFPEPLSAAVEDITELGGVRGQAAMMLLHASVRHLEQDLREARAEVIELRAKNDGLRTQLAESAKDKAVLQERLDTATQGRWVSNVLSTLGGIVVAIAAPSLGNPHPGFAIGGAVLGLVLLAIGWLLPLRNREAGK